MNDSTDLTGRGLKKKVEDALAQVRPYLEADGGGVQLVAIDETSKTVKVRLTGGCACCPSAGITLKNGVEAAIRKAAPEIKNVEAV
ncbi:MAG: NifU family protein [Elusimicrobia bacterium]|nr:NifU family protein [Elusimicrobiota bacterium]